MADTDTRRLNAQGTPPLHRIDTVDQFDAMRRAEQLVRMPRVARGYNMLRSVYRHVSGAAYFIEDVATPQVAVEADALAQVILLQTEWNANRLAATCGVCVPDAVYRRAARRQAAKTGYVVTDIIGMAAAGGPTLQDVMDDAAVDAAVKQDLADGVALEASVAAFILNDHDRSKPANLIIADPTAPVPHVTHIDLEIAEESHFIYMTRAWFAADVKRIVGRDRCVNRRAVFDAFVQKADAVKDVSPTGHQRLLAGIDVIKTSPDLDGPSF